MLVPFFFIIGFIAAAAIDRSADRAIEQRLRRQREADDRARRVLEDRAQAVDDRAAAIEKWQLESRARAPTHAVSKKGTMPTIAKSPSTKIRGRERWGYREDTRHI